MMGQKRMGKVDAEKEEHATKKKAGRAKKPVESAEFMRASKGDLVNV
jgi:hypothetical protein